MLINFRNRLPDVEEAGGAAINRVVNAASSAAKSAMDASSQMAKEASSQMDGWAKDGLDSMRTRPFLWGTASLGVGALMGGLFALWQRRPKRAAAKTMPARARAKQTLRKVAKAKSNGANGHAPKKRARKAKSPRSAEPQMSEHV
jgi:hypothetical protein